MIGFSGHSIYKFITCTHITCYRPRRNYFRNVMPGIDNVMPGKSLTPLLGIKYLKNIDRLNYFMTCIPSLPYYIFYKSTNIPPPSWVSLISQESGYR